MTLEEIKTEIHELRLSVDKVLYKCDDLWCLSEEKSHEERIADYWAKSLAYMSAKLDELEKVKIEKDGEIDNTILLAELDEWFHDLTNRDKAGIVGIPAPCNNGWDEQCEFYDYCERWWKAKTISQRQEIYKRENDMYNMYEECHQP